MTLPLITLIDTYRYGTGALAGTDSYVDFGLAVPLTDPDTGARIAARTETAQLTSEGALSIALYPGVWRVTERIAGTASRQYPITVPASGSPVLLSSLLSADTLPPLGYALSAVILPAPLTTRTIAGVVTGAWDSTAASIGDTLTVLSKAPDVIGFAPPTGGGAPLSDTDPVGLADTADAGTATDASRGDHGHPRTGELRWRGEWDAATAYDAGDVVSFPSEGVPLPITAVALGPNLGADHDPDHGDWEYLALPVYWNLHDADGTTVYSVGEVTLMGGTLTDLGGNSATFTPTVAAYSAADPLADGTADPGSGDAAHGDHVHPLSDAYATAVELAAEVSTARAAEGALTTAVAGKADSSHAARHTNGADQIANAVAGGNAGLLSGADKTKLDSVASGAQPGTVTSVDVAVPGVLFTVSGTPITGAGTATLTLKTQNPNTVLAGPASGGAAAPTMRILVAADVPDLSAVYLPVARLTGGGVLATGGFTLTVPATGTAALVGSDNAFSVGQGVRGAKSSNVDGLYVPWLVGDTHTTAFFGNGTTGNNQIAIQGQSDSNTGVFGVSLSNVALYGQAGTGTGVRGEITGAGATALEGRYSGSSAATPTVLILRNRTTGTPASGTGLTVDWQSKSDTTNDRSQLTLVAKWATVTDASRKAQVLLNVWDTAPREAIRLEASGSAPMIGFLGASAVVRQTLAAAATDAATVITLANSLRTALLNLGLGV